MKTRALNWNNLNVIWIRYSPCPVFFSQSPGKIPNGGYNLILSALLTALTLYVLLLIQIQSKTHSHIQKAFSYLKIVSFQWMLSNLIRVCLKSPKYCLWAVLLGHSVFLRQHLWLTWCPVWRSWGLRYCYLSPRLLSLIGLPTHPPTNMWSYLFTAAGKSSYRKFQQ